MVIKATIIKVLFAKMYVNVVFVIRCLYSAVSLTLVKEWRFIRIIYYYYSLWVERERHTHTHTHPPQPVGDRVSAGDLAQKQQPQIPQVQGRLSRRGRPGVPVPVDHRPRILANHVDAWGKQAPRLADQPWIRCTHLH